MRRSTLDELPAPRPGTTGWPWTEEVPALRGDTVCCRVSIVMTSFNQAPYLEEAIRSVLLQGYPKLDLIINDGGSTDGSVEVIGKYEPWLANWISEGDRGQSHAINKGFTASTGQIITFLSSDDLYRPGTLEHVVRLWRCHPDCGAIVGAFRFVDDQSQPRSEVIPPRVPHRGPVDLALVDPAQWRLHQVACFYSAAALDGVGRHVREDLPYTMDRELLYRVCRKYPVVTTERYYADFRRHETSKSVSQILPFSEEMAALQFIDVPEQESEDRCRSRANIARYRRACGYLKLAGNVPSPRVRIPALLRALLLSPHLALHRSYAVRWLDALGIGRTLRRLRRVLT